MTSAEMGRELNFVLKVIVMREKEDFFLEEDT